MSKPYLLIYSSTLGTRAEVKRLLDDISQIKTWRYEMPNSFFLISDESADDLVKLIKQSAPHKDNQMRFFITEIPANRQGWMTPDSWYFILQKPKPKPKQ